MHPRTARPLGHNAFGSTPHLPGSKTGVRDRTVPPGQAALCLASDGLDRVIVTEKLDGSCTAVWHGPDGPRALGRRGDCAAASRSPIRRAFAAWVSAHRERFASVLRPGDWLAGEWCLVAHGTRYALPHEPWVPFALFSPPRVRGSWDHLTELASRLDLATPKVLHDAVGGLGVDDALSRLGTHGHHGALDIAEGAVWVVERGARVIQTAKVVRQGVARGRYLADHTGGAHVLNSHRGATIHVDPG